jgi:hypothetical protein
LKFSERKVVQFVRLAGVSVRLAGVSVRFAGESVRLACESVRLAGVSVRLAGVSVRLAGESFRLAGVSVRLAGESAGLAGVSVRLAGESVRLACVSVRLVGESVRLAGVSVRFAGMSVRLAGECVRSRRVCSSPWKASRISERKCTGLVSGNCLLVTVPDTSRRLNPAPKHKQLFSPGTTKNQNQCKRRTHGLNRPHRRCRHYFKRTALNCHFNCCFSVRLK